MTYPPTSSPSSSSQPTEVELHLLYVLLDSNLPTGGFVSSSGLESFAKHGFLSPIPPTYHSSFSSSVTTTPNRADQSPEIKKRSVGEGIVEFAKAEVKNYAMTTGSFVGDSWTLVHDALRQYETQRRTSKGKGKGKGKGTADEIATAEEEEQLEIDKLVEKVVESISRLDKYHEATLLSHVGRRSSKAQGVAMLTLYTRGLSKPTYETSSDRDQLHKITNGHDNDDYDDDYDDDDSEKEIDWEVKRDETTKKIVDSFKRLIRKNESPGHLAVCWGLMTSCLGLSLDRSIHLHLFLHARSLLSSAVRLNLIGPYLSSQLLLNPFRQIIDDQVILLQREGCTTGLLSLETHPTKMSLPDLESEGETIPKTHLEDEEEFWKWTEEAEKGPSTTWPLGEILMARHDLQHSRIFNS
ncbi:uncharacterized protein IL334_005242 [Kwoniella shivajii]|uniref:Cytoplasmic protein n=1 Tax=Kwoniella shivajii TaxID=564305 RepID=A0ABZ1D331_9TREE|nr:hypothetical protein IL334_005242 [Kwoniella shivajii]